MLIALLMMMNPVFAADWPQWRGPARDGSVPAQTWPDSLKQLDQMWRMELGESYSGPIVADGMVFVTETFEKRDEIVRALKADTGEEVWRVSWAGSMEVPFFAKRNGSWIRATPAYGDGLLFVPSMKDVLVALDGKTGKMVWKIDFTAETGIPQAAFGNVSSPLVDDGHVYMQVANHIFKIKSKSGEIVWSGFKDGDGMMSGGSFSSPVIATIDGTRQLVAQGRLHLAGVSLEDGSVLWKRPIPSFRGMNILTPIVYDDRVFTSTYRGKSYMFDINGEETDTVWENKAMAYMSTPLVIDDHIYMHLQQKLMACLNLKTGEETWRSSERFGDYWSMAHQGDKILALDEGGELLLIKANPKAFELIDRREISNQPTWAHLAVTDGVVYVRELKAMAAYRWR